MAPTASSRSLDVLWSIDRNAATKALAGVALGYRDTLINLLCRDINETASRFGDASIVMTNRSEEIVKLKTRVTDQDHVAGPASAAITLVEYGNFECIQCGSAYRSLKQIRNVLADELRLVFRHFPMVQTHPVRCAPLKLPKLPQRRENFGRCMTNCLRTRRRWKI